MTGLGSSCGACKFLRRKCAMDCVFAPYFCYEEAAAHFAAVHKVFGASNVSKLLSHLPIINRSEAAITISYEALARMHDPVYGCISQIFALQRQVASLQEEIETLANQMAYDATLDASNVVNSQEMNFWNDLQASSSQLNGINAKSRLSQEALLLPQTVNSFTTSSHGFCSQMMMNMEVPVDDQNCGSWTNVSLIERLFQGMDYGSYTN